MSEVEKLKQEIASLVEEAEAIVIEKAESIKEGKGEETI